MGDMEQEWARRAAERQERIEAKDRAMRDARRMLAGQPPQHVGGYGGWKPIMSLLLSDFEQAGAYGVQTHLMMMLQDQKNLEALLLLEGAVAADGQRWLDVLRQMRHGTRVKERGQEQPDHTTRDRMADEIMVMLWDQKDHSRTEIYAHFSRNVSAERLNEVFFTLERRGLARRKMVSTGGRKREVWHLSSEEEEEQQQP